MKGDKGYAEPATSPPDFAHSRTRHQRARTAGMDPDYWYAVEWDRAVRPGQVVEVTFWKRSIALYRGTDGVLRAVNNRCAHRQLPLTEGAVDGCLLTCQYHGWRHDGDGRVAAIPHDLFGHPVPRQSVGSYPVAVRYGLIWIFPGRPELAEERTIPDIPELTGDDPWWCVNVGGTWRGHHSMIIDNVSDFTHAFLHRKYQPFGESTLTGLHSDDDRVTVTYRTAVNGSGAGKAFINPTIDTGAIELCYVYPYQWSDTGGKIRTWCFVLPIDERTTRTFFLFMFAPDAYRVPYLPVRLPRPLVRLVLWAARLLYMAPLIEQDRAAIEAEQAGFERHHDIPVPELNPAVSQMQELTIRKWTQYADDAPAERPVRVGSNG